MNDPGFITLAVVLLGGALFLVSPTRYRHWSVLAFAFLAFMIALLGLPYKFVFFLVVALLLWGAAVIVEKRP